MTGPLRAGPTARSSDVRPFPAVPFPDRYYGLSMSLYRRRVYASALLEVTGFAMPCLLTLTGRLIRGSCSSLQRSRLGLPPDSTSR